MKVLRLWLLVVLAVLLPVRGAMAVGMPCAPAASASRMAMTHEMDDMADHAAHMDAGHAEHHGHDDGAPSQDKCTLCAASCAATPLASTFAGVPAPHAVTAAAFPGLSVPAPSFLSDGQERPPRSI